METLNVPKFKSSKQTDQGTDCRLVHSHTHNIHASNEDRGDFRTEASVGD